MDDKKALDTIHNINEKRMKILEYRNSKYSSKNDFIDNFVATSKIAENLGIHVKPSDVALILAILKIVRNSNAKENGEIMNQRFDHIVDLHNYLDLSELCEIDKEQNNEI